MKTPASYNYALFISHHVQVCFYHGSGRNTIADKTRHDSEKPSFELQSDFPP